MNWVLALKLLLKVTDHVLGIVRDRQLLDAGAAKAVSAGMRELLDAIDRKEKRGARLDDDPDLRKRVRNAVRRAVGD